MIYGFKKKEQKEKKMKICIWMERFLYIYVTWMVAFEYNSIYIYNLYEWIEIQMNMCKKMQWKIPIHNRFLQWSQDNSKDHLLKFNLIG